MKLRCMAAICATVLAACGGTHASAPAAKTPVDASADAAVAPPDATAPDTSKITQEVGADAADALAPDVAAEDAPDVAAAPCPGGFGCECKTNGDCDSGWCLDTPAGMVCGKLCDSVCPDGFTCQQMGGVGGDVQSVCVPKWGWRCEPCTASSQCAAPGQVGAQCVRYGDAGSFCGTACSQDADCGSGFGCQSVQSAEGTTALQCVRTGLAACDCSVRATKLSLATSCANGACQGKRSCGAGGLSACDAPTAVTEVCDSLDNDCNGKTDEGTCDDSNVCTTDSCEGKACVHAPANGLTCTDGDACTAGDACAGGACVPGPQACGCEEDSDCAAQEDGDACNGTLFCNKVAWPYKCSVDPKTVVSCSTSGDTPCAKTVCDPKTGSCNLQAVAGSAPCDDGNPCTMSDVCSGGTCQAGANLCTCASTADCAAKEDGNACNGTLVCDKASFPFKCVVDPLTVVVCPSGDDTVCATNTCSPATGQCAMVAVPDGAFCTDNNACTTKDACAKGSCVGIPENCSDGNVCTSDDCAPASGCTHSAVAGPCEDGNACTLGDLCSSGSCVSGAPPSCTDGQLDGKETGIDCGGQVGACGYPACKACGNGLGCDIAADCVSVVCDLGTCATPTCGDFVQNQGETGIDCGGPCLVCPIVLAVTGGQVSFAASMPVGGSWSATSLGIPTVDGVTVSPWVSQPGKAGAVGLIRFTKLGDPVDNALEYTVWDGAAWSAPKLVGTGIKTQSCPTTALWGAAAAMAYHGLDFKHYFASFDGAGWSALEQVGSPQAYGPSPPSLAVSSGTPTLAYMAGGSNHVTAQERKAGTWSGPTDLAPAPDYSVGPVLLQLPSGPEFLVAYFRTDWQIMFQTRTAGTWSAQALVPIAWTKFRPALSNMANGQVMLAFHGNDGYLYTAIWTQAAGWTTPAQVGTPGATLQGSPALARGTKGADVELAWVALDGTVWHARGSAGVWSQPVAIGTGGTSVALTVLP